MDATRLSADVVAFGPFELSMARRELRKCGIKIKLHGQSFQVLAALLEKGGAVATREELRQLLWPDRQFGNFDHSLNMIVNRLRERLGDVSDAPVYIETVPGAGYRFIAPVLAPAAVRANPLGPPAMPRPGARGSRLPWAIAAFTTLLCVAMVVVSLRRETTPLAGALQFSIAPPEHSTIHTFSLAPDGRYLALAARIAGRNTLFLYTFATPRWQALGGTDGATLPFWSPDSHFIAFFAHGKLKKLRVATGSAPNPPEVLCDAPDARGGAWNRDGTIVFAPGGREPLRALPAAGGAAVPVGPARVAGLFPAFLPDGRHFLFQVGSDDLANSLDLSSIDSKEQRRVLDNVSNVAFAPGVAGGSGHLLFVRNRTRVLMAQPFDGYRAQLRGEAFPVAEPLGATLFRNYNRFAIGGGLLAYTANASGAISQLVWFDRKGARLGAVGEPGDYRVVALSPDQKHAAVAVSVDGGPPQLQLMELARGTTSRFTFSGEGQSFPVWSPDGSSIAWSSGDVGHNILRKPWNGAGKEERLLNANEIVQPVDWTPRGILFIRTFPATKSDLWFLPTAGDRKPVALLQSEFREDTARFSPDGRWIAYTSDQTGRFEIYIQPSSLSGARWQISSAGGETPRWRHDGKELFYLAPDKTLMAVALAAGADFHAATPQPLFQTNAKAMLFGDVSADGKRFLINTPLAPDEPRITVVANWQAAIKR